MRFPFPPSNPPEASSEVSRDRSEEDSSAASSTATCSVVVAAPDAAVDGATEASFNERQSGAASALTSTPESEEAPVLDYVEGAPEPQASIAPPPAPRPPAQRKVIAFPRQASLAPDPCHRLADPVVPDQPRILDVPEELEAFPCAPLLDGLHLPSHATIAAPADHVELPFQPASVSQRVFAGMIDCVLVGAAGSLFGAVCYKMLPNVALTKPILLIASTIPILLWATYQYLLTMYGGATIGMRMLHMRLSTFKGGMPNWRYRRSRVIGLYFSAASLAMGLLWALVDVDALCWHDRISRTYLTKQD